MQIGDIFRLANFKVKEEEKKELEKSLTDVLSFVDKLNEVELTEEEKKFTFATKNVIRKDEVIKSEVSKEDLLKQASNRKGDYVKVPKILESFDS